MGAEGFLELDLLLVAAGGVQFGAEAMEGLGVFGGTMAGAGGAFAAGREVLVGEGRRRWGGGARTRAHRDLGACRGVFASAQCTCARAISCRPCPLAI